MKMLGAPLIKENIYMAKRCASERKLDTHEEKLCYAEGHAGQHCCSNSMHAAQ